MEVYICIGKSKDAKALVFEKSGSDSVFICFLGIIMLRAVQFDNQFCLCTVEINNVVSNLKLSAKLKRIISQALIP